MMIIQKRIEIIKTIITSKEIPLLLDIIKEIMSKNPIKIKAIEIRDDLEIDDNNNKKEEKKINIKEKTKKLKVEITFIEI